jgi:hypothetical protein
MTLHERPLFGIASRNHPMIPRPARLGQLEARRRTLTEERTGQIVVNEPGVGYIALSTLYEAKPVSAEPQELISSVETEQMLQLPLFET